MMRHFLFKQWTQEVSAPQAEQDNSEENSSWLSAVHLRIK